MYTKIKTVADYDIIYFIMMKNLYLHINVCNLC